MTYSSVRRLSLVLCILTNLFCSSYSLAEDNDVLDDSTSIQTSKIKEAGFLDGKGHSVEALDTIERSVMEQKDLSKSFTYTLDETEETPHEFIDGSTDQEIEDNPISTLQNNTIAPSTSSSANHTVDTSLNWPLVLLFIFISMFFIYLSVKLYVYKSSHASLTPTDPHFHGISGWLIVIALIIGEQFIFRAIDLSNFNYKMFTNTFWIGTTHPLSPGYSPNFIPVVSVYLIDSIFIVIFSALLIAVFFKRKHIFPQLLIVVTWANTSLLAAYVFLSPLAEGGDTFQMAKIFKLLFYVTESIILTTYALCSIRVKNTFINP